MSAPRSPKRALRDLNRSELLQAVIRAVGRTDLTLGDAVRALRVGLIGMDRTGFATIVGVSERALAQIETGQGNPTLATLEKIFGKFGLHIGLVGKPGSTMAAATTPLDDVRYREICATMNHVLQRNRRG